MKFCDDVATDYNIVIVAPHPDDEVLGCGGLIARLVDEGKFPHIILLTGGEASHCQCCSIPAGKIIEARRHLALEAAGILGLPESNIHFLDYPDGYIAYEHVETDKLLTLLQDLNPKKVLIPHKGEGWPDHVNAAKIIKRVCNVPIIEYCVWMWYYNVWHLDWKNAAVLKMSSSEHKTKLSAVDAYISPLAPCGKPWSGVLPKLFVNASRSNVELYFKIR